VVIPWVSDPDYTKETALPHDTHVNVQYVKLSQLSKPSLHESEKVDCVIIEGGQDLSGAALDVLIRQASGPRIIFGDPYHQIHMGKSIGSELNFSSR